MQQTHLLLLGTSFQLQVVESVSAAGGGCFAALDSGIEVEAPPLARERGTAFQCEASQLFWSNSGISLNVYN